MPPVARHRSHGAVGRRLKRAEGHLRAVSLMLEVERDCLDVAQQLFAIERAVAEARRILIHDHVDHCLDSATRREAVAELKALSRYL